MDNSNMELWDRVSKTNPAHTKKVTFGRAITAIDPYRQIENATREFGPAGQGWGWEVRQVEHLPTNEVAVLVRVWISRKKEPAPYGNGFIEQWGQASLYIDAKETKKDKDLMKKATTDGLTKCLSCMGFNADIFLGKFDDNKYVQQMNEEFKDPEYTPMQLEKYHKLIEARYAFGFYLFRCSLSEEAYDELIGTFKDGDKTKKKKIVMQLEMEGTKDVMEVVDRVTEMVNDEDPAYAEELEGLEPYEKQVLASRFSDETKKKMTQLSKGK